MKRAIVWHTLATRSVGLSVGIVGASSMPTLGYAE